MVVALSISQSAAQLGWPAWSFHPSTAITLAVLAAAYEWGARRATGSGFAESPKATAEPGARSSIPTRGQRLAFYAGLLILFLALDGPFGELAHRELFSAQAAQTLLLTLFAPPLLLAGMPGAVVRALIARPTARAMALWLTRPIRAFVIFNVVLAVWHLPPPFDAAMTHESLHALRQLTLVAAALLMWWPLLSPLAELPRIAYPAQMLYCFLLSIPVSIIAVYIVMADQLLYPAFAGGPARWGLSPLEDQRLGGLILWIPGGLFFYGVMSVAFFKWANRGEDDEASAQAGWTRP